MGKPVYLRNVSTLKLNEEKCSGCGTCLNVCPQGVLGLENRKAKILELDSCMECGACSMNCATGAIEVKVGVGCAMAVINSALGRSGSSCCCIIEPDDASGSKPRNPSCC